MKKSTKYLLIIIVGTVVFLSGTALDKIIDSSKCKTKIIEKVKTEKNGTAAEFKENENVVFLGDSITEIYPIDDIYTNLPIVKSGVSGYKTNDILDRIDSMLYEYNPTKVILLIGTNDISEDISEENIKNTIEQIEKISKAIKKNRKNTKIYIESIYPVNRSMDKEMVANRTNDAIQQINKEIKLYCKKNNMTYINMYDELTDEDGNFNKKYTYDGLHPNTLGYAKITQVLIPYIFEGYEMK